MDRLPKDTLLSYLGSQELQRVQKVRVEHTVGKA